MNTARRLTPFTMIAAILAAAFVAQAADAAGPAPQVVQLETVYITGKRLAAEPTRVVQLPLVTIIGRRSSEADALLAQKAQRAASNKAAV